MKKGTLVKIVTDFTHGSQLESRNGQMGIILYQLPHAWAHMASFMVVIPKSGEQFSCSHRILEVLA